MNAVLEVRELTRAIKGTLEGSFPFVWVKGEVTNLSRPSSGHLYFSLRDAEASIATVWFKGNQGAADSFNPLTGEVYEDGPRPSLAEKLDNGMEVLCAGRITAYPARSTYQLIIEIMQEAGKGRLQLEFELLKARLAQQGYFDTARKRPLPASAKRIAVITSPTGAAIHDFLRIATTRGLPGEVRIYPTIVQGDDAPKQIAACINTAASAGWADVIVVIRGGGSLEDLWAFNSIEVADAIFNSVVPVLAGIGHEVDFSLADMTADVRAATPTHAAQILWAERRELMQALDETELKINRLIEQKINFADMHLSSVERTLRLLSPVALVERSILRLESCTRLLKPALEHKILSIESRFKLANMALVGLNPRLPLERGYTIASLESGTVLRSVKNVSAGDKLELLLADGSIKVEVQ